MTDNTQTRIDRLEEALAHNDITLGDLSDELAVQGKIIDRQNRRIADLEEKIGALEAELPDTPPANQPPPHY